MRQFFGKFSLAYLESIVEAVHSHALPFVALQSPEIPFFGIENRFSTSAGRCVPTPCSQRTRRVIAHLRTANQNLGYDKFCFIVFSQKKEIQTILMENCLSIGKMKHIGWNHAAHASGNGKEEIRYFISKAFYTEREFSTSAGSELIIIHEISQKLKLMNHALL